MLIALIVLTVINLCLLSYNGYLFLMYPRPKRRHRLPRVPNSLGVGAMDVLFDCLDDHLEHIKNIYELVDSLSDRVDDIERTLGKDKSKSVPLR